MVEDKLKFLLGEYSRTILQNRLREEKIPFTEEAMKNASEIYAEKLIKTLEVCASNLVEADISNLQDIFTKLNRSSPN